MLQAGDRVLVGTNLITIDQAFSSSLSEGDKVIGIGTTGALRRIPAEVAGLVDSAVQRASRAFAAMADVSEAQVSTFFRTAAARLESDETFAPVREANVVDVESARSRGRSTTRLVLDAKMRSSMVDALRMWENFASGAESLTSVAHDGWSVTEERAPLGVIGFVFEGRPNVFADASGVLRGGNTVVFRIGSDALGTASSLMDHIIGPAIREAGLPDGCIELLDSPEHAAGWALFADSRLSLAVARGSGDAVAELGAIAQQSGVPVSLHGTGGAWMIVAEGADLHRLDNVVKHSLDRKVCNTLNVVCVVRSVAAEVLPVIEHAARDAASVRGVQPRIHAVGDAMKVLSEPELIEVHRAHGIVAEPSISQINTEDLGREFEWENTPEFSVVLVNSVTEACDLFNEHSPQFVVSCISEDIADHETVWKRCNAPFVGDGFTRWVDGQFALLRPELGLSNWQNGRLFARGGVLSGDSAYTVRLRVTQSDSTLHR
jgi:glutamate-5-semialdehyde dehydrogenase